ncbi:MAG: CPBP family intramembrane glutamate endopeptidase, partial [Terracoccus sp.]
MTQHGPIAELRAFVTAALVQPVERKHWDPPQVFRRRQIVVILTLLVGSGVLAWALRITPGDPLFYLATLLLAAIWVGGALASGPLHAGMGHTRRGDKQARPIVQSLVLGLLLLLVFLLGALAVARIPFLREP